MSDTIDVGFVEKFNDNIQLVTQQIPARMRLAFMESQEHGEAASPVDYVGTLEARQKESRHQPAIAIDPEHTRRWVHPNSTFTNSIVDTEDKLRMNTNPEGPYLRAGVAAQNREIDDVCIAALHGTALTGRSAGTSTTLPAGNIIAVTEGAGANDTGMNIQKLLAARKILLDGDVDLDDPMNQLWSLIGPQQEQELLLDVRVSNKDYGDPIFDGTGTTLKSWFGINFIVSTRAILDSNSDRECALWAKSGMHLGVWQDIKGNIVKRDDIVGEPFGMTTALTVGATRVQEEKVMQILCDES